MGPLSVAINPHTMKLYKGGLFTDPKCIAHRGDQDVLLLGYGSDKNVTYWIVGNSWGTDWGEDGYMRLLRNVNHCGIADTVVYPVMNW